MLAVAAIKRLSTRCRMFHPKIQPHRKQRSLRSRPLHLIDVHAGLSDIALSRNRGSAGSFQPARPNKPAPAILRLRTSHRRQGGARHPDWLTCAEISPGSCDGLK
jgi:hypothetical protein